MATLAEIRAKLQAQTSKPQSEGGGDNAIYPHWNIAENSEAVLRFLPDKDPNNTFFWTERAMIKLPFNSIKGDASSSPLLVQVPCMEMYGEACPVLAEVRPWFKDKSLEDMGRKYWKKRSYVFQGFVVNSPMQEEVTPENPIRRFIIGPQIFNIIKSALMDPEMEDLPTDYTRGVDFRINKTTKGGYADYSTSKWSRKTSPLTAEQQSAIDTNGLHNLGDYLPKKPTEVEVKVIEEMFKASVDGEPYDLEKFGQYYRPYGLKAPETSRPAAPVAPVVETPAPAPAVETVAPVTAPEPVQAEVAPVTTTAEPTPAVETGSKAEDILAMIRARQQKS
jgi:hypothetical protein